MKNQNGSAYNWGERSPCGRDTGGFCYANYTGNADFNSANYALGVSFGFCS